MDGNNVSFSVTSGNQSTPMKLQTDVQDSSVLVVFMPLKLQKEVQDSPVCCWVWVGTRYIWVWFGPSISAIAPRKRPRTDSLDGDPFDIDRFIGGAHIQNNPIMSPFHPSNTGESSRPPSLPDLNSQLNSSQSEGSGEHIPDTSDRLVVDTGIKSDSRVPCEIEATIAMGKELGVNLENFEDIVCKVIEGERVLDVVQ
ncbi:hypothetical protein L1987_24553 [Smallanthus sonchifolius]|uniref:Uncharacterized protein n=1 Tax=Smallanthus sonchifolius TaxID=185202 RepID=A0ACB9IK16_9ASTR|nr:hypothetical protein L1987_24553 [Smallanthus sonchifolius]